MRSLHDCKVKYYLQYIGIAQGIDKFVRWDASVEYEEKVCACAKHVQVFHYHK